MPARFAFFGATGGCAGSCLAAALRAGYTCRALARTPSKLENALAERGLSDALISTHLTIVCGDVGDLEAAKRVLADADVIISGVGAYPHFQWSICKPLVLTDSTICADATATILKACQALHDRTSGRHSKPILIVVSTAGVQEADKPRALPLAYLPWYGWLLADPLADKVAMEDNILAHMELLENQRGIDGYVIVKPSILTDGKGDRIRDVRAGTGESPPVGYSIDREMVGMWIFRRLIEEEGAWNQWKEKRVTITY